MSNSNLSNNDLNGSDLTDGAAPWSSLKVNGDRLYRRLAELGRIGGLEGGGCARLALTDQDRAGRDQVVAWMTELDLLVSVDQIGNVVGVLPGREELAPVMMGSHIDTVQTGGIFDGNLGVLAGLEVVETIKAAGHVPRRPLAVAFFTDEEGARFPPDMLGSLVYVGAMSVADAHEVIGIDGQQLGAELERVGYLGSAPCPGPVPHSFVELHIEQGPVLEREAVDIGVVSGVQGISWQRLTIAGQSAHAGTTPIELRHDAAYVAAQIVVYLRQLSEEFGGSQVATVGSLEISPNLINVVAQRATLTVDLRNTDENVLRLAESRLSEFCDQVAKDEGVSIDLESLARFEPVEFDDRLVNMVEQASNERGLSSRQMPSGAGHDAQMFARVCPSGMIFVPSVNGISHNVSELTYAADSENGANVLLDVVLKLAEEKSMEKVAEKP